MRKAVSLVSVIVLLFLAAMVFIPRSYQVPPMNDFPGTAYWDLPTGSRIAYVHLSSRLEGVHRPLVYLHGGPGGHVRADLIKALEPLTAEGFDLYFYDQLGSGSSSRLDDIRGYTVDRHVQDLLAITQVIGATKPVIIGQSWGAILATIFASRFPDKMERIVLTCPGPVFPVNRELAARKAPDSLQLSPPVFTNAAGNKIAENLRTKAMYLFASSFGWQLASDHEADSFATYGGYFVDRSTVCDTSKIASMEAGAGYYAGVWTFKTLRVVEDYRQALRKVNVPVLVLKGQCDNQPWGYTSEYLDLLPNSRLRMIAGAGHFLWIEKPSVLRKEIINFLNEKK